MFHKPVLLNQSLNFLLKKTNGIYIDATIGGGGHTKEILKKFKNCKVIGIDRDLESLCFVKKNIQNDRLFLINENFASIDAILQVLNIDKVDGILIDLGLSSYQIDQQHRGFSYIKNSNIDMRMDQKDDVLGIDILKNYNLNQLIYIFKNYGEEKKSQIIAKKILNSKLETTSDLKKIIFDITHNLKSVKRIFQAIRIEVNNELESLKFFLEKSKKILNYECKIVIISYHSLEDRIVKNCFKFDNNFKKLNKTPITPDLKELKENSRSKSAKLRAFEKVNVSN